MTKTSRSKSIYSSFPLVIKVQQQANPSTTYPRQRLNRSETTHNSAKISPRGHYFNALSKYPAQSLLCGESLLRLAMDTIFMDRQSIQKGIPQVSLKY